MNMDMDRADPGQINIDNPNNRIYKYGVIFLLIIGAGWYGYSIIYASEKKDKNNTPDTNSTDN